MTRVTTRMTTSASTFNPATFVSGTSAEVSGSFTSRLKTQTRREGHGAPVVYRLRFLFFFDCDHFATLILPAVGADGVRQAHSAAVGAGGQVRSLQRIMRAAAVTAAFRVFTLWLGAHLLLLYDYSKTLVTSA